MVAVAVAELGFRAVVQDDFVIAAKPVRYFSVNQSSQQTPFGLAVRVLTYL